jgi:hypothetical protein
MVTITIQTEETTLTALQAVANQKQVSLEDIAQEALRQYLQRQTTPAPQPYSFIGIGHSGKKNASSQIEAILVEAANRREG